MGSVFRVMLIVFLLLYWQDLIILSIILFSLIIWQDLESLTWFFLTLAFEEI